MTSSDLESNDHRESSLLFDNGLTLSFNHLFSVSSTRQQAPRGHSLGLSYLPPNALPLRRSPGKYVLGE